MNEWLAPPHVSFDFAPAPPCRCAVPRHTPRFVVLTGGPGAGKTAVLEVVRRHFCKHLVVLPEAASILFAGGFPRGSAVAGRRAAQRAIFEVQRELEAMHEDEPGAALVLCDRGTLDGLAYTPDPADEFLAALGTSRAAELARYARVIHLRTPTAGDGYNHRNPVRVESADEARAIDERILTAWEGHPRRVVVPSTHDFLEKLTRTLAAIAEEVPTCCRAAGAAASAA
jgi:predicted ATPase